MKFGAKTKLTLIIIFTIIAIASVLTGLKSLNTNELQYNRILSLENDLNQCQNTPKPCLCPKIIKEQEVQYPDGNIFYPIDQNWVESNKNPEPNEKDFNAITGTTTDCLDSNCLKCKVITGDWCNKTFCKKGTNNCYTTLMGCIKEQCLEWKT